MNVIDKKQCNEADILEQEIDAMQALIDRRWGWLNKPENKLRRTYQAVLTDTREMELKVADMLVRKAEIRAYEKLNAKQTVK